MDFCLDTLSDTSRIKRSNNDVLKKNHASLNLYKWFLCQQRFHFLSYFKWGSHWTIHQNYSWLNHRHVDKLWSLTSHEEPMFGTWHFGDSYLRSSHQEFKLMLRYRSPTRTGHSENLQILMVFNLVFSIKRLAFFYMHWSFSPDMS